MRTLSIEEAVSGLGRWLELAIAGEDIRIRKGDAVVELRPVGASGPPASNEHLSPREALRCLQTEARLTPDQAQQYVNEVYDERLADRHDPLRYQLPDWYLGQGLPSSLAC
jgi:hypothetical protein